MELDPTLYQILRIGLAIGIGLSVGMFAESIYLKSNIDNKFLNWLILARGTKIRGRKDA